MEKEKFYQQLVKKYSVTYYWSSQLFPQPVRQNVFRLYAFLRLGDEVVDNPVAEPRSALKELRKNWLQILENDQKDIPVDWQKTWDKWQKSGFDLKVIETEICLEMAKLLEEFKFDPAWIEAFFWSMERDLSVKKYDDWEELNRYILGSAEVVGLMMNKIMGVEDNKANNAAARALGWAMQMTNFVRDIEEDWGRGRIYLPVAELEKLQMKVENWGSERQSAEMENLLKKVIREIFDQYEVAIKGAQAIPKNSRLAVLTSIFVYRQVLEKIARKPLAVWRKNFKKTFSMFPRAIWRAWWYY